MGKSVRPEIYTFDSLEKASQALADDLVKIAMDTVAKKGRFALALSGGKTPRYLYSLLARKYSNKMPWEAVHLFWGDERCVPKDHVDSNFKMACQTLISKIQIPAQNIHRIHAELNPPERAAESYEEKLKEFFNAEEELITTFDVTLLGVGSDGHTASLFPQSPALEEKSRWVVAVDAPSSVVTRQRITLSFPVINRSSAAFFLVYGEDKKDVVRMIFDEPDRAQEIYPAARVRAGEKLVWYVGQGA